MNNHGMIDLHYHADPDLYDRKYSAIDAAKEYQKIRGAVVLRSHLGGTATQASLLQSLGLPALGSVSLNAINGGIHYKVIVKALSEYRPQIACRLVVDLPTLTGRKHQSALRRAESNPQWAKILHEPCTLFDSSFKLKKTVIDILKCAAEYPVLLSTGHASAREIDALIDACLQYRVPYLLVNQPANPMTGWSYHDLIERSTLPFLWFEQTALTYFLKYQTQTDFVETLLKVPNLVYSSDLGQTTQMSIREWLEFSIHFFEQQDIKTNRRREICWNNPLKLLGICPKNFEDLFYSLC